MLFFFLIKERNVGSISQRRVFSLFLLSPRTVSLTQEKKVKQTNKSRLNDGKRERERLVCGGRERESGEADTSCRARDGGCWSTLLYTLSLSLFFVFMETILLPFENLLSSYLNLKLNDSDIFNDSHI